MIVTDRNDDLLLSYQVTNCGLFILAIQPSCHTCTDNMFRSFRRVNDGWSQYLPALFLAFY